MKHSLQGRVLGAPKGPRIPVKCSWPDLVQMDWPLSRLVLTCERHKQHATDVAFFDLAPLLG